MDNADDEKCCLRDHMTAKAPWTCPCECHLKSEPEPVPVFTPEQEGYIENRIAEVMLELRATVLH